MVGRVDGPSKLRALAGLVRQSFCAGGLQSRGARLAGVGRSSYILVDDLTGEVVVKGLGAARTIYLENRENSVWFGSRRAA
jgi:hypothetical protein